MTESIRLYAWRPDTHSIDSFYVVARSEEEARACVDRYLADENDEYYRLWPNQKREPWLEEWGTDVYRLTTAGIGEVLTNSND